MHTHKTIQFFVHNKIIIYNLHIMKIQCYSFLFFCLFTIIINSKLFSSPLAINGKYFAGEIHYSRIPVEYWNHRLQMIRGLGMNAISVYIMWNYHQVQPALFDFQSDNKNITKFLELAALNNLSVFIRPGPYVCAEWDFGGLPAWLLQNYNASVRSNNPTFMKQVQRYINTLGPILRPFLKKNGGPIVLLQIENQYGSFGSDLNYIEAIRKIWSNNNIEVDQYHADPPAVMANSHWFGANIGVNGGISEADYTKAKKLEPTAFIFGGQIYPGWLTRWGDLSFAGKSIQATIKEFQFLVKNNHSFSMYMVHGGTNFGFTAGANTHNQIISDYNGIITSYDYDAPINEQGAVTNKYNALRALFLPYTDWEVLKPPANLPLITINEFTPTIFATILNNLPVPIILTNYTFFESKDLKMYHQGIIIYETILSKQHYQIEMIIHDYAIVFLDGILEGYYDREKSKIHILILTCNNPSCKIQIFVEAMGHINFGKDMNNDRKGLIHFKPVIGELQVAKWKHYKIPLDWQYLNTLNNNNPGAAPVFSRAYFGLKSIGDTYLNLKNFIKGYVWINGHNLGRYWNKGPQSKLFCPGVWLKSTNELIVLQLVKNTQGEITGQLSLSFQPQIVLQ